MAVIAKFVTFDGGIAFSEQAMKIQNRGEEAVIFPLRDIASMRIRRPQEDRAGFIRVNTVDGHRYMILFSSDDLQKAIQFKADFDATMEGNESEFNDTAPREEPLEPQYRQRARESYAEGPEEDGPPRSGKEPSIMPLVIAVVVFAVIVAVVAIVLPKRSASKPEPSPLPTAGEDTGTVQPSDSPKDFDGSSYGDKGDGIFALMNESGSTAEGNPIVIYTDADTALMEIGYETTGINGSALTYIYIDGHYSFSEKVGDSQGTIVLQGSALTIGTHKVELVQYFYNSPNYQVNVYKSATYEVRGK